MIRTTGSETIYNDVIEKIGTTIDAAGVVMIVVGAVIAFVVATVWLSRRDSYVYRRFRHQLGQAILLGLELLVAGDIVRTVAASPRSHRRGHTGGDRPHPHLPELLARGRDNRAMAMAEARDYRPLDQVPTIAERDCLMIGITDLDRHAERCLAGRTTDDRAARRPGPPRPRPVVLRSGVTAAADRGDRHGR